MIKWIPDTCHCIIICPRPSVRGTFEKRCNLHRRTNSTLIVYAHNVDNRLTANEFVTFTIKDPNRSQTLRDLIRQSLPFVSHIDPNDRPQVRVTAAGIKRIKDLKESTR